MHVGGPPHDPREWHGADWPGSQPLPPPFAGPAPWLSGQPPQIPQAGYVRPAQRDRRWVPIAIVAAGLAGLLLLSWSGVLLFRQVTAGVTAPLPGGEGDGFPVPARSSAPGQPLPKELDDLQPVSIGARCVAPASQDSAGVPILYSTDQMLDGRFDTAWRCPGAAVGEEIVIDFGRPVTITALALVPGYAKIDPHDGVDRFSQNRTITGLTWGFDNGSALDHVIARPSPQFDDIELTSPVETRFIVLEIKTTGNESADRDFTAISELAFVGFVPG